MRTLAVQRRDVEEARRNEQVRAAHQRAVRWRIVAPVVAIAVLMIVLLIVMIVGFSARQVGIASNFMSLLLLVPAVLLCFIPYALLVPLVVLTGRFYRWLPPKMRTARNLAHSMNTGSQRLSAAITRPIIRLNQRFAWAESVVKQITGGTSPKEEKTDAAST